MTSTISKLGQRLLAAKSELGLNGDQLADLLGISPEWVSKITRGRVVGSDDIGLRLDALYRSRGIELGSGSKIESDSTRAEEDQAPYGTTATLEADARKHLEGVIAAAKGEPARLGWIVEQLQAHLAVPAHWRGGRGPLIRVTTPSQTQALSTDTGLPIPAPSRRARSA